MLSQHALQVVSQHALQQVSRGCAIPACIAGGIPACPAAGLQGVPGPEGLLLGGAWLGGAWSGGCLLPRGWPSVMAFWCDLLLWPSGMAFHIPKKMATVVDGTHPTGKHSCFK